MIILYNLFCAKIIKKRLSTFSFLLWVDLMREKERVLFNSVKNSMLSWTILFHHQLPPSPPLQNELTGIAGKNTKKARSERALNDIVNFRNITLPNLSVLIETFSSFFRKRQQTLYNKTPTQRKSVGEYALKSVDVQQY